MKKDKKPRDDKGLKHGHWEVYYDDGQLNIKCHYKHGERHGFCEEYYPDGQLYEKGFYINNEIIGLHKIFEGNVHYTLSYTIK